jgi:hypothetical protein
VFLIPVISASRLNCDKEGNVKQMKNSRVALSLFIFIKINHEEKSINRKVRKENLCVLCG